MDLNKRVKKTILERTMLVVVILAFAIAARLIGEGASCCRGIGRRSLGAQGTAEAGRREASA